MPDRRTDFTRNARNPRNGGFRELRVLRVTCIGGR